MTEEQVAQMRATYCGLMSEVDDQLGRVFDYLKESGQWDDTLIVFTCDHGEQLGDHHLLGKIGYTDESFRIPMIVRDPRAEANGTRGAIVERFTETIDTMPTILDWLGLPVPRQCDGRSLLGFCEGQPPADWRTEVHYEFDFRDLYYSKPEIGARRADGQVHARRRAGRGLQVRPLRRPAAALVRSREGPRPVHQSRHRSGLCRKARRILRQDARLAPRLRRSHADRLPRHAQRSRSTSGRSSVASADLKVRSLTLGTADAVHGPNMRVARSQQTASVTQSLSPHAIVNATALITAAPLEIHSAVTKWACGRVEYMARNHTPAWLTLAATIFVAAHASALETLPGEPPVEDKYQATQERIAPPDEPLASGRVVAVDRAGSRITLEYRPIPQLFLDGGTRIFQVGDPTSLKGLGPGDKVRFEVERDGRSYTITRLVNSN